MRRAVFFSMLVVFALAGASTFGQAAGLPPAEAGAKERLLSSPRHGEWVKVAAAGDSVDAWVVYPGGGGTSPVDPDTARKLVSRLQGPEVVRRLNAVASCAAGLPAATGQYAVVGYCWGGGISFSYATEQPALKAAVVYYGVAPATESLARIRAPVLGLYGGSDARVDATILPAAAEMKRLGRRFDYELFDGAGHAFLRAQDGQNGANPKAAQKAWPRMVEFLKQSFGTGVTLRDKDKAGSLRDKSGWRNPALAAVTLQCPCGNLASLSLVALRE